MDLHSLTIIDAKKGLKNKHFTSVELTKAYLERIKKLNRKSTPLSLLLRKKP